MEPERWCFANEQGRPHPIGEAELRAALSQGKIAPETLVWRAGWSQWLPAEQVKQFSRALGARARATQAPTLDSKQRDPPPLPLATGTDLERVPRFSTPIPAAKRQQPLVRRPPVPTMTEIQSASGGTLRPPGAVPPPPRGAPKSRLGESDDWDISLSDGAAAHGASTLQGGQSHRPSQTSRHAPNVSTAHCSGSSGHFLHATEGSEPLLNVPADELSSPQQSIDNHATAAPYDPDSLDTRPSTPNWHASVLTRVQLSTPSRKFTVAVVGLAVVSVVLGFWLTLRPARNKVSLAVAVVPRATPQKPMACSATRVAQRISPAVLISVTPIAAESPVAGRMMLGFAEGPTTAAGLSIDTEDLDVGFPFRESKESRVISVTPLLLDGGPSFYVLREGQALKQARAVDASHDFLFGLSESGFVRQSIGGGTDAIWPLDAKPNLTDPRLASISGFGHAVTFRKGGQAGSILLGWLTEPGRALLEPVAIPAAAGFVGTPTVAASDKGAMVAYAGRSSETSPWTLFLSRARPGQPPEAAFAFEAPTDGPAHDNIAPAVVALPHQRWLLQWSSGPPGQRQVRIQTLDSDARPIGLPQTVSPAASNSGQGLLWAAGKRAVSLFVVNVGRSSELWAAPISCPE